MSDWLWPLPGINSISSDYRTSNRPNHKGIDIAGNAAGKAVIASRAGAVTAASNSCSHNYGKDYSCCGGSMGSYGNYVDIDHGDGYLSRYAHMSVVYVSAGDSVAAGDVIGLCGSTGHSTGPHLHFEIRYGGSDQNPNNYVNPANTIVPPSTPINKKSTRITSNAPSTSAIRNATTSGPVKPVMVSDFSEGKPLYPFLQIFLGDYELKYTHGKPSIIQSFEITRLESAGCKANFTLFDDEWDQLEYYLAQSWNDVSIVYGYAGGKTSPRYKLILQDYSIDFINTGTILHISAISEGIYENLNTVVSLDTGTKNPTLAIKKICEHMGWAIDESDFVITNNELEMESNFVLNNDNPVQYIQQIIQYAEDNGEILVFDLEAIQSEGSSSNSTAHLKVKAYGENVGDDIPTYVYLKGYDSVIKDMRFDLKAVFGGTTQFQFVTALRSGIFDMYTKQETSGYADKYSVLTTSTGAYSATKNSQSTGHLVTAAESAQQMNNRLNYYIKNGTNQAFEATMSIIGDPEIELFQYVRIIVVTDIGYLHHVSGIYLVKGISDSIDNGEFTTTLKLIRNGDISEGIELMSPRDMKK